MFSPRFEVLRCRTNRIVAEEFEKWKGLFAGESVSDLLNIHEVVVEIDRVRLVSRVFVEVVRFGVGAFWK